MRYLVGRGRGGCFGGGSANGRYVSPQWDCLTTAMEMLRVTYLDAEDVKLVSCPVAGGDRSVGERVGGSFMASVRRWKI